MDGVHGRVWLAICWGLLWARFPFPFVVVRFSLCVLSRALFLSLIPIPRYDKLCLHFNF